MRRRIVCLSFWMALNGAMLMLWRAARWLYKLMDIACLLTAQQAEKYTGVMDIYSILNGPRFEMDREYLP